MGGENERKRDEEQAKEHKQISFRTGYETREYRERGERREKGGHQVILGKNEDWVDNL